MAELHAYIYLLRWNTRLVISDVDGTITKSDLLGHVLPPLGVDWSHAGITQLFHNIVQNGYEIMYLSARAIGQANITRDYLHTLVQNGYKMPSGPVIISPHGLLPSLYRCGGSIQTIIKCCWKYIVMWPLGFPAYSVCLVSYCHYFLFPLLVYMCYT